MLYIGRDTVSVASWSDRPGKRYGRLPSEGHPTRRSAMLESQHADVGGVPAREENGLAAV